MKLEAPAKRTPAPSGCPANALLPLGVHDSGQDTVQGGSVLPSGDTRPGERVFDSTLRAEVAAEKSPVSWPGA